MRNSIKITLIAILAATGIALRSFSIPIFADVQITPGMIAPILSGMLLGIAPGVFTGLIIGIYAGFVSGEFFLIPLIGNICLGLAPGIISELKKYQLDDKTKVILFVMLSGIIGGFLPTFGISIWLIPNFNLAIIYGLIDFANAVIAATIAVILWKALIEKFEELKN